MLAEILILTAAEKNASSSLMLSSNPLESRIIRSNSGNVLSVLITSKNNIEFINDFMMQ